MELNLYLSCLRKPMMKMRRARSCGVRSPWRGWVGLWMLLSRPSTSSPPQTCPSRCSLRTSLTGSSCSPSSSCPIPFTQSLIQCIE
ncbi:hypothetical protein DPMN_105077 [Dreissena polymorpha]|uniref:Uncharacterized protein n=1 Tax=Dreissena polymorpha TaxID=45954 RepID=A0A9D4HE66_DREPO|nr:hypothetical protein DPMN_105077 [Dreissena polymorpha]